jgi:tRNA U55 pseudouridine synthase TruB
MSAIVRTQVGEFGISQSITLEELSLQNVQKID